ncbi:MAG: hypothetical protein R6V50_01845 [Thermoplasmatota archaeon]
MFGDINMIGKKNLQKTTSILLALFVIGVSVSISVMAQQSEPALEIYEVKGGLGQVILTVKNTGDGVAEELVMSITVTGGIAGRIDIAKVCAGCGGCSNNLGPNETKTEGTMEEGFIFGFGQITITVSAEASNAQKIEQTRGGLVIGPLVFIP